MYTKIFENGKVNLLELAFFSLKIFSVSQRHTFNNIIPLTPNIITDRLKTLQNLMEENRLIDLVLIHISD